MNTSDGLNSWWRKSATHRGDIVFMRFQRAVAPRAKVTEQGAEERHHVDLPDQPKVFPHALKKAPREGAGGSEGELMQPRLHRTQRTRDRRVHSDDQDEPSEHAEHATLQPEIDETVVRRRGDNDATYEAIHLKALLPATE